MEAARRFGQQSGLPPRWRRESELPPFLTAAYRANWIERTTALNALE
jgi:hypothetical protein